MIPDIIKAEGMTIATFSDLWGYKMEAYDASVSSPKVRVVAANASSSPLTVCLCRRVFLMVALDFERRWCPSGPQV